MTFIVALPKGRKITLHATSEEEAEEKANERFKPWKNVRYAHTTDIIKDVMR